MGSKEKWLDVAEVLDAYRLVPRIILAVVLVAAGIYIYEVTAWYMALPAAERTAQVSGFAGVTIPAVFGLAGKITDWYLKTGRNWKSGADSGN